MQYMIILYLFSLLSYDIYLESLSQVVAFMILLQ